MKYGAVWALAFWLMCSWLAAGLAIGHVWGEFPTLRREPGWCRQQQGFATIFSVGGPLSLAIVFCASGFGYHGVMWRCPEESR